MFSKRLYLLFFIIHFLPKEALANSLSATTHMPPNFFSTLIKNLEEINSCARPKYQSKVVKRFQKVSSCLTSIKALYEKLSSEEQRPLRFLFSNFESTLQKMLPLFRKYELSKPLYSIDHKNLLHALTHGLEDDLKNVTLLKNSSNAFKAIKKECKKCVYFLKKTHRMHHFFKQNSRIKTLQWMRSIAIGIGSVIGVLLAPIVYTLAYNLFTPHGTAKGPSLIFILLIGPIRFFK